MWNLTGFQRDILVIAAGLDEPNGLEVKAALEDYYESEINHGRLYPNLDTLVEEEYLTKEKRDERTNEYIITDAGEQLLDDRRDWETQYWESAE